MPTYNNLTESISTAARKLVENVYIATFDSWFNVSIPTRVGYTFTGWRFSTISSNAYTITKNYGTSTSSYNSTTSNSFITGANDIYFRNMYGTINDYNKTTFSATWEANEYDIKYELGGGSLSSKPLSATYDEWFQVPNPTRTGYDFSGWTISGMTSGVTHYFGTTTSSYRTSTGTSYTTVSASYKYFKNLGTTDGQDITFTAVWDSKPYYISYSLNASGASLGTNSPTTVYHDSWFQVSNPTRTGYTFTGWTITNMTSGLTHRFGTSTSSYATSTSSSYTNSSTSRTYYYNLHSGYGTVNFSAGWSVNTYYIEYEEGDGTLGTSKPGSAKFDSWFNISAPSSVPVGYYYDGWIVSDASTDCTHYYGTSNSSYSTTRASTFNVGTNQLYFQNLHSQNGATVTLTINWHPYTYNIGYNLNGGEHGQYHPTTAEYDADVTISNPTRAGYTFTGWSFSGLNDECTHYFYYGSSWVSFTSTNGRYTDEVNVNYDRIVNATRFRNLGIEGGALVLTANWSANYYNITYHFLPASYDIVDDSIDTINTAGNMTATKTQRVRYDFNFKAYVSSVNALNSNEIELPQGVKLLFWVVNNTGSTYSSTTNLVSWNGDNTVASPISGKSINAGQEETYSSENGYAPRDIHVYAAYTFVDITIQYMVASGEDWRNDLSNYSTYSTDTTTYNSNYHLLNILSSGINGWLITPNHYDFGTLTEDSITTYTFDGTYYEATVGSDIFWLFSNTSAYDSENPVYYAYAVYYGEGANGYYITFESDDYDLSSLGYEVLWVTYDEWVNIPKPTRTGFNFVNWSITGMDNELHLYGTSQSSYQTTSATTLSTSATYFKNLRGDFAETVNFEAVWQRAEYKISYSLDGGTHGSSHPTTVDYDEWFNVSIPTKTGYSFSGWTISGMTSGVTHYFGTSTSSYVTSTGTSYSTNSSYTWFRYLNSNAGTVTFTAKWSINTYKISYSLGGGSYGTYHPTSATFNSWFQVSSPTRTGYTFNGWTISGMTSGLTHRFGTSTSSYVTSTGTSYTNSTTSRTYYYNLGSNSGQTITFTASWTVNTYTVNVHLIGKDSEGFLIYYAKAIYFTHRITLNYDVSYDLNYQTLCSQYGTTPLNTKLDVTIGFITADYYWNFLGFSTSPGDTSSSYISTIRNLTSVDNGVVDIYAKFYVDLNYTLNVNKPSCADSSSSTSISTKTYSAGRQYLCVSNNESYSISGATANITFPTVTLNDFSLLGWGTSVGGAVSYSTGSTISYTYSSDISTSTSGANRNISYYAIWNVYTISYDLDGGTAGENAPTTAKYDPNDNKAYIINISTPTKEGYTFAGWDISGCDTAGTHYAALNESLIGQTLFWGITWTTETKSTTYTYFSNLRYSPGTVTFTAKWTENEAETYTISVDYGNGTVRNYTATYDEWLQIDTPTRDGYVFDGYTSITGCTDGITHYIGYTASTTDAYSFTGESTQNIYARTYFLNMRSSAGTVTVVVKWKTS